ncbi:MAG TPA: BlaI/MecI/CopY family transcriptional regulator [Kofleriaceae bacterium]|nr:BlaI/MecI/CopY family transcriptional regulator [Kofleriaceae bacterium]
MSKTSQLGNLQLAILRVLWAHGEATAGDVHVALHAERGLAPTTIATMLKKMEARGLVTHREDGRRFIYRPGVTEEKVTRAMVADLTDRLFDGKVTDLVNHLIAEHDIDRDELAELNRLIAQAERQSRRRDRS